MLQVHQRVTLGYSERLRASQGGDSLQNSAVGKFLGGRSAASDRAGSMGFACEWAAATDRRPAAGGWSARRTMDRRMPQGGGGDASARTLLRAAADDCGVRPWYRGGRFAGGACANGGPCDHCAADRSVLKAAAVARKSSKWSEEVKATARAGVGAARAADGSDVNFITVADSRSPFL